MISLYPDAPAGADTDTSQSAARAMTARAGLLREQCLMLLQQHDLTADELAAIPAGTRQLCGALQSMGI